MEVEAGHSGNTQGGIRAGLRVTLTETLVRERAEAFPYFDEALRIRSTAGTPEEHAQSILTWLRQGPRPVDPDAWLRAGRGWN